MRPLSFFRLQSLIALVFLITLAFGLWPRGAQAALIPVNTTANSLTDDGFCSLLEAILAANNNSDGAEDDCVAGDDIPVDTIVLAASTTYTVDVPFVDFSGFTGLPPVTSTVVISGNDSIVERSGSTLYRLFAVGSTGDLTLLDLTVRNGSLFGNGGAIYSDGQLSLFNSTVFSNVASGGSDGGGLFVNTGATATISNSTIISNASSFRGGGIFNDGLQVNLVDSVISNNFTAATGAGIHNDGGTLIITDTRIMTNVSGSNGGGVMLFEGTLLVTGSEWSNNSATIAGGALYTSPGTAADIRNSRVFSNTASIAAGIYNSGDLRGTLLTVESNNASILAGGIQNDLAATAHLSGTTIYSNTSVNGGGLNNGGDPSDNFSATAIFTNSTIYSNTATQGGGGIRNSDGGTLTLTNSDVFSNSAGTGGGLSTEESTLNILAESEVAWNRSDDSGAGIRQVGGTLVVDDSDITTNTAGAGGGGLVTTGGFMTITNSSIRANKAEQVSGGGIAASGFVTATLTNVVISYNRAEEASGGGIDSSFAAKLDISDSAIVANYAGNGGGGIANSFAATTTITNSQILSNVSEIAGGGILILTGSLVKVSFSKIVSNTAVTNNGGGIYNHTGTVDVATSEILTNSSGLQGGGLYGRDSEGNFTEATFAYNQATTGGAIYTQGSLTTLTNSALLSNTATTSRGGGFTNFFGSTALINGGLISFNKATLQAGGLYNVSNATATINNATIANNSASSGGAIYNSTSSTVTLNTAIVTANEATSTGGALYNTSSKATLIDTEVTFNKAEFAAGIVNGFGSEMTMSGGSITNNEAGSDGGGFYDFMSEATFNDVAIALNTAGGKGGGLIMEGGSVTLNDSEIFENSAELGGGFHVTGTLTITDALISNNTAEVGAGLFVSDAIVSIFQSGLLDNEATNEGGAIHQVAGSTAIEEVCIVGNSDTAVNYVGGTAIEAANNWWGAVDGPGGVAAGHGDSVSNNVNFAPHLNTPIFNCPTLQYVDLEVTKSANKTSAVVGEQILYSYRITNTGTALLSSLNAVDDQLGVVPGLGPLAPDAVVTSTLPYLVDGDDLPGPLVNIVTVTGADALNNSVTGSDTVSVDISGETTMELTKEASTLEASVGDTIIYTYTLTNLGDLDFDVITVMDDQHGELVELITGYSPAETYTATRTHTVSVEDLPGPLVNTVTVTATDELENTLVQSKTVSVALESVEGELSVTVVALPSEARVGDVITFTYYVTNTGLLDISDVTITEETLGEIATLGTLPPGQSGGPIFPTSVGLGDLPGPLVRTVEVTGTDEFGNPVSANGSASVTLVQHQTSLPVLSNNPPEE